MTITTAPPRLTVEVPEANLTELIAYRYNLAQQVKELEAAIKGLSAQILGSLTDQGLSELETPEYRATVVTQTRTSLSERKLMDRGVPLHVIKECKDSSTVSFVKVTKRTEEKPDAE